MSTLNSVRMEADGKTGEVMIYDRIGSGFFSDGVEARPFAEAVKKLGGVSAINVRINSPGGDVFTAAAIYNTLKDHPAKVRVHVDGLAASAASYIAMAGDEINMAENAAMMIHEPRGVAMGTVDDILGYADTMDKIRGQITDVYTARTGLERAKVAEMLAAETWMTAREALESKFATAISPNKAIAASADAADFNNVPEWARPLLLSASTETADTKEQQMAEQATENQVVESVDMNAVRDEALKAERARIQEITAACKLAGKPEMAEKLIDAGADLPQVHKSLLEAVCKERACLEGDNAETTQDDGNGKYRQEYAAQAAAYQKIGMSIEDYIASRRVDDGLEQLTPGVK